MLNEDERIGPRAGPSLVQINEFPNRGVSRLPHSVSFDRRELSAILSVYGRKVAAADWRDYAIDFLKDRAVFSIYATVSQSPLYVVEKAPRLKARQGQYMVADQAGRTLTRGHDLKAVLRVLEPRLSLVRSGT